MERRATKWCSWSRIHWKFQQWWKEHQQPFQIQWNRQNCLRCIWVFFLCPNVTICIQSNRVNTSNSLGRSWNRFQATEWDNTLNTETRTSHRTLWCKFLLLLILEEHSNWRWRVNMLWMRCECICTSSCSLLDSSSSILWRIFQRPFEAKVNSAKNSTGKLEWSTTTKQSH
jgi:hypothetical protein